MEIVIIYI